MDVARHTFLRKGSNVFTTVARKTSCSGGWLRLVVQTIFAIITVSSFILIVLMAVRNPSPALESPKPPRCQIQSCRVTCKEAPDFGKHYEDIILSVSVAESKCVNVILELQSPFFDHNTKPENWLSNMHSKVHQLIINGGNLNHIAHGAFMSQFLGKIRIFVLNQIHIKTMESTSLVGLSNLRSLNILRSKIDCVSYDSLRAIDDTLETLTISRNGDWDPINFTGAKGFKKLGIVDFSYNDFNEILTEHSFVGLKATKILYLNSCRITAIGAGTFDHLKSIEVLYLNNNMLITVPHGIFSKIIALENPRPRINLQDNYWLCDCSNDDLRQMVKQELLLIDATCTYPQEMYSKKFSEFENICNNITADKIYEPENYLNNSVPKGIQFYPNSVYANVNYCNDNIFSKNSIRIISPLQGNKCSSMKLKLHNITTSVVRAYENSKPSISEWIRFFYFLKSTTYSVLQVGATEGNSYFGLLWYQSTCPHEMYCLDMMPIFLRVYSSKLDTNYTFCPINLKSLRIDGEHCFEYNFSDLIEKRNIRPDIKTFRIILYITTVIICLCFGALLVYGLIRRKPTLLKGSKRILFVKHKNVEALVLPPKVPLRNDLKTDSIDIKDNIFTLFAHQKSNPTNLERMKSVKSDKSGSPSYISAMQPTDDQLAEWRIKHHFNNDLTINSNKSELSAFSWIGDSNYNSIDDGDRTYESLK